LLNVTCLTFVVEPGVVHKLLLPLSGDVTILLFSLLLVKSSVHGSNTDSSGRKSGRNCSFNDSDNERYLVAFLRIP